MSSESEQAERRERLLGGLSRASDQEAKQSVRDSYTRLSTELGKLSPEQAIWKPDADEWSAAQIGDHIALSTGTLGNIASLLAKGETPGDADWDPAPEFKGDAADVQGVRRRLDALSGYTDELFDRALSTNRLDVTADNSLLGDLNWRQWYIFLGVHAASHVEQMEKLRARPGFPE